jgi:hypothetical protein
MRGIHHYDAQILERIYVSGVFQNSSDAVTMWVMREEKAGSLPATPRCATARWDA